MLQGFPANRMDNASQANGKTLAGRAVCPVEFTGQNLNGDVKPRLAIWWQFNR